jgi:T-complex protein 1 subunit gamma
VDIKRYVRCEKIPGGHLNESEVLDGIMLNKDVVHPKMARTIKNPRIMLLDCPLEYRKAESQTNLEISKEEDWEKILRQEEHFIEEKCKKIIAMKPDLVFTEKGVSDLAQHYLMKANITVLRRLRKTDNNRIARAVGANICGDPEDVREEDIGKKCGLFDIKKIGDEYFTYLIECKDPKACTVILRGASKDVLNEIERNLLDAMFVVRNVVRDPRVVPGGGAAEMAIGRYITQKAALIEGIQQWPFREVARALEVIPRTLVENCGASVIRNLTELRAKHAVDGNTNWGIDGERGVLADMTELKIFDSFSVKAQTLKTAIESAAMLLRIDDIVSGMTTQQGGGGGGQQQPDDDDDGGQTFGDARDG